MICVCYNLSQISVDCKPTLPTVDCSNLYVIFINLFGDFEDIDMF